MSRKRSALSDSFASVLQRVRTKKKLSRQELAQRAGLHQTYIGMIERGLSNPSLDAADEIANGLGMPLSELLAEAESLRMRDRD